MILKGNQRGGALQLARHLLNKQDNDHVSVIELKGFSADSLTSAMQESAAIAKGTRCRQFLFSVSLNPPEDTIVGADMFTEAADRIEAKLGLEGQPRALVLHEKDGRRHAHAVWSRIDAESMTAINLSHSKLKLQDVSKDLYKEYGWQLPPGLADRQARNPFTFSREEWQQAKRNGQDAGALKATFKAACAESDSGQALIRTLSDRGYVLAKGDRRAVVAVDYRGEVYALSRWAGVRAKEIKARFGQDLDLPSVTEAKGQIAAKITPQIERYIDEVRQSLKRTNATLALKQAQLKERHVAERDALKEQQAERWVKETRDRAARFRGGFGGLWDRLSGKHAAIRKENEREAYAAIARDDAERDELTKAQLVERRKLQADVGGMRMVAHKQLDRLRADVAAYAGWSERDVSRPEEAQVNEADRSELNRRKERDNDRSLTPE